MKHLFPLSLGLSLFLVACGGNTDAPVTTLPGTTVPDTSNQIVVAGGGVISRTPLSSAPLGQAQLAVFSKADKNRLTDFLSLMANGERLSRSGRLPLPMRPTGINTLSLGRQATSCSPPPSISDPDTDGHITTTTVIDCTSTFNGFPATLQATYHSVDKNEADINGGYSNDGTGTFKVLGTLPTGPTSIFVSGIVNGTFTLAYSIDDTLTSGGGHTITSYYDSISAGNIVINSVVQPFNLHGVGNYNLSFTPDANMQGVTFTINGGGSITGYGPEYGGGVNGVSSASGSIHYNYNCPDGVGGVFAGPDSGSLTYTSGGITQTAAFSSCTYIGGGSLP